ncbi:MAG TPA: DCC1-like thiol-disulfide oxidoreductase family protein [Pyrinomonadaceae bacterium]|nr:DCC1-like thiol-disulfide oxidoreductase family protein [Pyrinomonadaceae bacterium]
MSNPIVLYDGVCGLCNRLVQFLLKHDRRDRLRYASLQSDFASSILTRQGANPHDLDTVYVVVNHNQPGEKLLARSDAILALGKELGGIWSMAVAGKVLPRVVRDGMYKLVARNRYRVFGKHESCMMPEGRYRWKFLDVVAPKSEREIVEI